MCQDLLCPWHPQCDWSFQRPKCHEVSPGRSQEALFLSDATEGQVSLSVGTIHYPLCSRVFSVRHAFAFPRNYGLIKPIWPLVFQNLRPGWLFCSAWKRSHNLKVRITTCIQRISDIKLQAPSSESALYWPEMGCDSVRAVWFPSTDTSGNQTPLMLSNRSSGQKVFLSSEEMCSYI